MRIIYIFFNLLLLVSCYRESVLDIDGAYSKEKLVIYSLLSPQTDSIFVSLTKTSSDFKQYFDTLSTLPEGTVIIRGDGQEVALTKISSIPTLYGCAQNDFQIKSGFEYNLFVQIEGFDDVTAKTRVPEKCIWINASKPVCSIFENNYGLRSYVYTFKSEFTTSVNPLENNRSLVNYQGYEYVLEPSSDTLDGYRGFHFIVKDTLKLNGHFYGDRVYSTIDVDKKIVEMKLFEDYVYNENKGNNYYTPIGILYNKLTFYLFTYDANHSESMNTLRLANKLIPSNDIDDFTSSSAIIPSYSNIDGGYGVFGSYVFDSISFDVSHDVLF